MRNSKLASQLTSKYSSFLRLTWRPNSAQALAFSTQTPDLKSPGLTQPDHQ